LIPTELFDVTALEGGRREQRLRAQHLRRVAEQSVGDNLVQVVRVGLPDAGDAGVVLRIVAGAVVAGDVIGVGVLLVAGRFTPEVLPWIALALAHGWW